MDKIIDLVLLGILIVCAWTGYKKGIIMGIGGILVIIVAIYGANLLSNTFSYEVIPVLRPFANGYIESQINDEEDGVLVQLGLGDTDLSIRDLVERDPSVGSSVSRLTFRKLGIAEDVSAEMADLAVAYSEEMDVNIITATTEILCERLSFVACFVLAFALIAIALTVIGNITNLSFKIPGADLVNDVGGAVLGVFTGILFCFLIAWALKYTGIIIKEEVLEETWIASKFIQRDLLSQYIGA